MSYDRFHKKDKAPTVIVGCLIALVVVFMVYKYFMKPKRGSACPSAKMTPTYVSSRSDLDSFINSEEDTTVMYYAPWCGHCNKAKPEFEEAMKNNKNMHDSPYHIVHPDNGSSTKFHQHHLLSQVLRI